MHSIVLTYTNYNQNNEKIKEHSVPLYNMSQNHSSQICVSPKNVETMIDFFSEITIDFIHSYPMPYKHIFVMHI